jgi:acyl carrier protein phosphodiesterase
VNYLAHLYLSGNDPLLRIGNLAGDFIKGCPVSTLHPEIRRGIALHHLIDSFTDRHAIVSRSKKRMALEYAPLAGIFIDIFYDHFLAKNWANYSRLTLEEFSAGVYADLERHHDLLPPRLKAIAPRVIAGNWLPGYQDTANIKVAIARIGQRLKHKPDLANGSGELLRNYRELENDFREFFQELVDFTRNYGK